MIAARKQCPSEQSASLIKIPANEPAARIIAEIFDGKTGAFLGQFSAESHFAPIRFKGSNKSGIYTESAVFTFRKMERNSGRTRQIT